MMDIFNRKKFDTTIENRLFSLEQGFFDLMGEFYKLKKELEEMAKLTSKERNKIPKKEEPIEKKLKKPTKKKVKKK
jgi:hypothetical protein